MVTDAHSGKYGVDYPPRIVGCRCLSKCHALGGSLGQPCVQNAHSFQAYSINIFGQIMPFCALDGMQGLAPYTLYTRRHKSCHPSEGGISLPRHTQLPTLLGLIIFNHYRRGIKTIVASGKEEVAHPHLVIVGFDGVG